MPCQVSYITVYKSLRKVYCNFFYRPQCAYGSQVVRNVNMLGTFATAFAYFVSMVIFAPN